MEFFFALLTTIFVIMLIVTALSFGFALLVWFITVAFFFAAFVVLRDRFRRWRFLYHARKSNPQPNPPRIIEADYEDISGD